MIARVPLIHKKKGVDLSSHNDMKQMTKSLREGPLRFAPIMPERHIEDQVARLPVREMECFEALLDAWDVKHPSIYIPDDLVLRYARSSPSETPYDRKATGKLLSKLATHPTIVAQLSLSIDDMVSQLRTKTLFPLPGLRTIDGNEVIYMRPARFSPSETPTAAVLDNLAYCVNAVMEREAPCKSGVAFMANMNGWTMQNYGTDYCLKFMKMLQGLCVPVHVTMFLIVNPPRWFKKVWAMMKPMLSKDFQKRVRVIPEDHLAKYLAPGYTVYLPDEMVSGKAPTDAIVQDFIAYRAYVECVDLPCEAELTPSCDPQGELLESQKIDDKSLQTKRSALIQGLFRLLYRKKLGEVDRAVPSAASILSLHN